jgi:hypothetical protein
MTKLKLAPLEDNRPVKITLELPASVHRNLKNYADLLARANSAPAASIDPAKLIVPMIERFMATDRAFTKARRDVNKA